MHTIQKPRILFAEDSLAHRNVLVDTFEKAGYTVLVATEGYQARQIAQREELDLIVTDVMMPVGGGEGLLQSLKRFTRTASIPVIVLTAKKNFEKQGKALGAFAVLEKPVTKAALMAAVEAALLHPRTQP